MKECIYKYIQRMGRSLMLPVACLPAAALFVGIGNWIASFTGGDVVSTFLTTAGGTVLNNLGILFAVGLAFGMAKDQHGAAALAGLVGFLTPMTLLTTDSAAKFLGYADATALQEGAANTFNAFSKMNNGNVFIGILAGLIAAAMYNRFHRVKLTAALSFFSGKRLVPIVTVAVMAVVSLLLLFIWPVVFGALTTFGELIMSLGPIGAGIYGFLNRLLIPTGLHHALNNVFWFNIAGIDDIARYWQGAAYQGDPVSIAGYHPGMYQAGFFPIMMFGLPAGAFAIYKNARPERKKAIGSLMLAAGIAAFFTGVTEPLEFSFMFVAFPLYVVHAVLTGLSVAIAAAMNWTSGFNFSAGLVDFVLGWPLATKPYMLIVQGLVFAVIYYFVFDFAIRKFNLMTPGREAEEAAVADEAPAAGEDKYITMASRIYAALGGASNVKSIENCTTRLRLVVNDTSLVDQDAIKKTGVPAVKVLDKTNLQVIVGTDVQFVADAMNDIAKGVTVGGDTAPKA